jgi:hypothetical protein
MRAAASMDVRFFYFFLQLTVNEMACDSLSQLQNRLIDSKGKAICADDDC